MARPRHPKRDEAARLWLESKKKMPLDEVARQIGVSASQIRKWKCEDKWNKLKLLKVGGEQVVCAIKKSGGQIGNKNAVGAGAPIGNKNAVTTGEFEAIFFDTMTDDEKSLINCISLSKRDLLLKEIQLLTVRERRMLTRIEKFKAGEMQTATITTETETSMYTQKVKSMSKFSAIQTLEESLTRVQALKRQHIELLEKIERGEMECW